MQVSSGDSKLKVEGVQKNRETVDLFGQLEKIDSDEGGEEEEDESAQIVLVKADLNKDKLLLEDDPDNYLT